MQRIERNVAARVLGTVRPGGMLLGAMVFGAMVFGGGACTSGGSPEVPAEAQAASPAPVESPAAMPAPTPEGGSKVITNGSKVSMHYTLTVDGEIVDSSEGKDPLAYTHGAGNIIPGLESELAGLAVGAAKSVEVAPAEGYGERSDEAIQQVPRSQFQDPEGLAEGSVVMGESPQGPFRALVTAVDAESITLDLNHPLAGKTLHFQVQIVGVD